MPSPDAVTEFRASWLPHITDAGLERVMELLDKASPLLIHGSFDRAMPMGCLASHVAWNHPETSRIHDDAGVVWLTKIARLNPATSALILAWDREGVRDFALRTELLQACREDRERRLLEQLELAEC